MTLGETHRYEVELRAGEYLQVLVEQRGVDVTQTLTAPDGRVVLETDSPCAEIGPDPLAVVVPVDGVYGFTLKATTVAVRPGGRYDVRVEAIRQPRPADLERVRAVQAGVDAYVTFPKDARKGLAHFIEAAAAWEALGERRLQMWFETMVGFAHAQGLDQYEESLRSWRRPLETALELRDEFAEARLRFSIGQSLRKVGRLDEAREQLERSLALHRDGGRENAVALVLGALGDFFSLAGEPQEALDRLEQALRIFQTAGNARSEAITRNSIGTTYLRLGDPELALEQHRAALRAFSSQPWLKARAIGGMGTAQARLGDRAAARAAYVEALGIYHQLGNRVSEADISASLGDLHAAEGDWRAAMDAYASALPMYESRNYTLGEGLAHCRLAEMHHRLGDLPAARAGFEAAQARAPRAGPLVAGCAWRGLAQVAMDAGDLAAAQAHAEAALGAAESSRADVAGDHARSAALGSQQPLYELLIEVLMRRHAAQPMAGYDGAAFDVSERGRARSLLELVAEGRIDVREGISPALLAEERSLRRRLNTQAEAQAAALAAGRTDQAEAVGRDVDALRAQWAEAGARLRRASAHYGALAAPQPLRLAEIQARVLDGDTQLLQYALGQGGSYLWVVSARGMESFTLAPGAEIERVARRLHERLASPARGSDAESQAAIEELSRLIVTPAATALTGKRLLVVAPGALQYVPFAALTAHATRVASGPVGGGPLLAAFEVSSAPSASVIATLRSERRQRQGSRKAAVFADPVFEQTDPRVAGARGVPERQGVQVAARGGDAPDPLAHRLRGLSYAARLGRLPFSRREADSIAALSPKRDTWKATGFEANRDAATSPRLAEYRIVHFATHAILNARRPELSGVVLSLVDEQARRQDGFLRLHDVYNLRLNADLVVLSGCQTALGKDLKGEGLVGLTRGFMYAGAKAVVASLWQVDDESTAELMKRFYRGMLKENRRPADALRQAQLEMSRDRRWSAPFYWAGFVLQGEWR